MRPLFTGPNVIVCKLAPCAASPKYLHLEEHHHKEDPTSVQNDF